MAKCDLCNEYCNADKMATLQSQYQIDGIKDLCTSCANWANNRKLELLGNIPTIIQAELLQRRGKRISTLTKAYLTLKCLIHS